MSQPESVPQPKSPESKLLVFLQEIYGIWISERPTQFAAALAYYAIFSFVPVIYIAFTITELVIERLAVEEQFYAQIANLLGAEIAQGRSPHPPYVTLLHREEQRVLKFGPVLPTARLS
jgi:uncharacterized BrkB/YihY/UPF0761 family membrane protein